MKKIVIITHPNLESSVVNKRWANELAKHPDHFMVYELYEEYPTLNFNIEAEQELIMSYDEIIFQFPIHWYSTPFALKKYIDEVFTYGWAFGPDGDMLKGKKIGFAISTGGQEASYCEENGLSVSQLLNDFQLTFEYCGCEITSIHTFYGAMFEPNAKTLTENAEAYVNTFIKACSITSPHNS